MPLNTRRSFEFCHVGFNHIIARRGGGDGHNRTSSMQTHTKQLHSLSRLLEVGVASAALKTSPCFSLRLCQAREHHRD